MVRGLVQDEQVDGIQQRLCQGQPGPLPARQVTDNAFGRLTREPEAAQNRTQISAFVGTGHLLQLLNGGAQEVETLHLVLRKRGHVDVAAQLPSASHGRQRTQKQFDQRRLASAVGPDNAQLLASLYHQIGVRDNRHAVIADGDIL